MTALAVPQAVQDQVHWRERRTQASAFVVDVTRGLARRVCVSVGPIERKSAFVCGVRRDNVAKTVRNAVELLFEKNPNTIEKDERKKGKALMKR